MTKTQTPTMLVPESLAPLTEVFYEDALAVVEQLNWSAGKRPVVHASLAVGPAGWAGGPELGTINLKFPAGAGWQRCLIFKIDVKPETVAITVGAECFVSGGQTCQLRVTIGASGATSIGSFTSVDVGTEKTCTIATSSSGTGDGLIVLVERNHSAGTATDCFVRNFRVEADPIAAADLPDPEDA